ncbi:hypothetical protein [Streptosporangium roseum]|uniref:hypothetical protein n=1 Tax=Streptosporangium roseum TaxID=2001 RepID=UPI0033167AC8
MSKPDINPAALVGQDVTIITHRLDGRPRTIYRDVKVFSHEPGAGDNPGTLMLIGYRETETGTKAYTERVFVWDIAAVVPGGDELTDAEYEIADQVEAVMLAAAADKTWTPSEMGRKVKADTTTVRNVLTWMVARQFIDAHGNGARTRFARQAWRTLSPAEQPQEAPVPKPVVIDHVRISTDDSSHVRHPDTPSRTLCSKNVGGSISGEGMDDCTICTTRAAKRGMVEPPAKESAPVAAEEPAPAFTRRDLVTYQGEPFVVIQVDTPGEYALIRRGDTLDKPRLLSEGRWVHVGSLTKRVLPPAPETRTEYAVQHTAVRHGRLQVVIETTPGHESDRALNEAAVSYVRRAQASSVGPVDAVLVSRTVVVATPWAEVEETPQEAATVTVAEEPTRDEKPAPYAVMIREELIDADRTEHADPAMVALIEQVMRAERTSLDYLTREEFGDAVLKALNDVDELYAIHVLRDYCRAHELAIPAWARRP